MKKGITLIMALVISLFLYGCGNGDMGTETTKMPNELTDQNQYSSTEAEESNELLGSWYSDAEGIVVIFLNQEM